MQIKALGFGKQMQFVLTGGERHQVVAFPEFIKGGIKRQGRGRSRHCRRYLGGDKSYSSQEIRQQLRRGTTQSFPNGITRNKGGDSIDVCTDATEESGLLIGVCRIGALQHEPKSMPSIIKTRLCLVLFVFCCEESRHALA